MVRRHPESIKANSDINKVNVLVFNENDTFHFHGHFNPTYERTVAIAFRKFINSKITQNKNHYDSIIEIDSNDVSDCVKKPIGLHSRTVAEVPSTAITCD